METAANATAPVVVERVRRPSKPKRHRLEENPPPPIRALTVEQIEAEYRGLKGKLRDWIKQAYADNPDYAWLKFCIIRISMKSNAHAGRCDWDRWRRS